ncbi:hypothetical protein [Bacillus thuringiensis]|uniref:hypothetical protein n=1 Tax=Bacillus thuringiensis TaxID=1428 RepID=UPI0026E44756|nr:hypothetical protein [Bacillus thuringiensis]MDO6631792.1 hypothetical protein [Bacillus thuringiensis]MDO6661377.1 hypothetical protein [Bacillus thuringiensis]MDO6701932.1 hypothetical protein [Bacillus thuringiensis]
MEHIRQLPISFNESGDLVIKRTDNEMIEKLFALVQTQFASQNNHLTKVGQDVGKLGEAVGMQTEKVECLDQTVGSFDNRLTEAQRANVAPKIIRDQLQQERHEKAKHFVENTVQLTFEAIEGTKSDLEQAVRELIKKDATRVMRQITSYMKRQLGLKSIDNIPNCLVEKHKQLLKELTWKKLDAFMKKGSR